MPDVVVHDSLCLWSILAARIIARPAAAVRPTYAANAELTMRGGGSMDISLWRRLKLLRVVGSSNRNLAKNSDRYGVPRLRLTDLP
jgi:hypothetical protein